MVRTADSFLYRAEYRRQTVIYAEKGEDGEGHKRRFSAFYRADSSGIQEMAGFLRFSIAQGATRTKTAGSLRCGEGSWSGRRTAKIFDDERGDQTDQAERDFTAGISIFCRMDVWLSQTGCRRAIFVQRPVHDICLRRQRQIYRRSSGSGEHTSAGEGVWDALRYAGFERPNFSETVTEAKNKAGRKTGIEDG